MPTGWVYEFSIHYRCTLVWHEGMVSGSVIIWRDRRRLFYNIVLYNNNIYRGSPCRSHYYSARTAQIPRIKDIQKEYLVCYFQSIYYFRKNYR